MKDELELVFPTKECKKLGIDRVLMDCNKTNIGSAKSIIANGGVLENEIYQNNELIQRYCISLKKRYADKNVGGKCSNTIYKIKFFETDEFKGDVVFYKFINVNEKILISNGKPILDKNYKWLEFYDYNAKIKLTAIYNENNEIVEWYFDIAKKIGKENGIPYEDDLYLDVVVTPEGKIILLDENELEAAFNRLEINKADFDMAYEESNKLIKILKNNINKLKDFTDKYFKEMIGDDK